MHRAVLIPLVLLPAINNAAPSVLNATTHASTSIAPAITAALGAGHIDSDLAVDYFASGSLANIVAAATNASATYTNTSSANPVNHQPYTVLNASLCCYTTLYDRQQYAALVRANAILSVPLATTHLPAGSAAPVVLTTVTSPNSADGPYTGGNTNGSGLEFGLPTSYKGLDTSEDSWDSAAIAGFIAALLFNHPTWNPFDAKTALRITANQWATGYSNSHYGFGLIDWDSANLAATLFLQGPGMSITNQVDALAVTLYPYRQSRREHEEVYSVNATYPWPLKNEYTHADITTSGATLLFVSHNTDITPQFLYVASATGTLTLVAFTTDGAGHYSRIEPYSAQSATLLAGPGCTP